MQPSSWALFLHLDVTPLIRTRPMQHILGRSCNLFVCPLTHVGPDPRQQSGQRRHRDDLADPDISSVCFSEQRRREDFSHARTLPTPADMMLPPIFRAGLPFRIQRQATRTWTDMRAVSSRTTLRGTIELGHAY